MRCKNCGAENRNTNIQCDFCNEIFDEQYYNNCEENFQLFLGNTTGKRLYNVVLILLLIPWLLIGLLFIGVSTYSMVSDFIKSRNYLTTNANLIGFSECEKREGEEELCSAIYEYIVEGITYKASPSLISSKSSFNQTYEVRYNPDNPKEYSMNKGWNFLFVVGIIMIIVPIMIFVFIQKNWIKVSFS